MKVKHLIEALAKADPYAEVIADVKLSKQAVIQSHISESLEVKDVYVNGVANEVVLFVE